MIVPIVFAFDECVLLPASIAIKSLLDSALSTTQYQICILHPGFNSKTQRLFSSLVKDTPHAISFYYINKEIFINAPKHEGGWSEIVYYRLLIPRILPMLNKVIYSDIDVLIKQDLTDIYRIDLDNYHWAGVIAEVNNENTSCHKYFPENKNAFIYMSGFMVMNLSLMRQENMVEKFFTIINEFQKRLRFFDLDVLNIACSKIRAVPFYYALLENIHTSDNIEDAKEYPWLTKVYSHQELLQAKERPIIIHYAGKSPKIWRRKYNEIPKYYWEYIEKSPFYKRYHFFPSIKMDLLYICVYITRKIMPIKSLRQRLKRKEMYIKKIKERVK